MSEGDLDENESVLERLVHAVDDLADKVTVAAELAEETSELARDTAKLAKRQRKSLWLSLAAMIVAAVVVPVVVTSLTLAGQTCRDANEDRANDRELWAGVIERSVPGPDATPEEIAEFEAGRENREAFVADINMRYAPRDC